MHGRFEAAAPPGRHVRRGGLARALGAGRRAGQLALLAAGLLILAGVVLDLAVDAPLRRRMERTLNERLDGYTVAVGHADFHVLGFGLDLEDIRVVQARHPDPPVALLHRIGASVEWRALLFGRVVADIVFDRPVVSLTREHAAAEDADPVPVHERGWQEAVEALYPFRIDRVAVTDGTFSYRERADAKPLTLGRIRFEAENIRNVRSRPRRYPSPLRFDAAVFDTGRISVRGHADFLAAPHAGLRGTLELRDAQLDYFDPVAARYDLQVEGGRLSADGSLEYAPTVKTARVRDLHVDGLRADWVRAPGAPGERRRAAAAREAVEHAETDAPLEIQLDRVRLTDAVLGYESREPPYRVFLNDTRFELRDFTNRADAGEATAELHGLFLGKGPTEARGVFRPGARTPDFSLEARLDQAPLPAMNDLLRAYAGVDVTRGSLTVATEVTVRDGVIEGYVTPELKDLDVYHRAQDEADNPVRQLYEATVGGVAEALQDQPRDAVATRTSLSGRVENPQSSLLEILTGLVQNAFFEAILPRLEAPGAPASGDGAD